MLESVGKDSVVPGLLASTFAGSSDEDIARACEKMRAPPGARWDVSAKIKMRDEKLREVRTMLSRVAEQRRAFGTLVTKIEEKLLSVLHKEVLSNWIKELTSWDANFLSLAHIFC